MHDLDDLNALIDYHQQQAEQTGRPPHNLGAWRKACKREMLANEHRSPGHIERATAGIRARAIGQRITGWREVRGTHGIDHIPDPNGTDRAPWV